MTIDKSKFKPLTWARYRMFEKINKKYPVTKVFTPSIKLVPFIKTNVQNKVKINFIIKIFSKLSKKSTLIEDTKLSNINKYAPITIVWNMILKKGECKIFKSDNSPVKNIKNIKMTKSLLVSGIKIAKVKKKN